MLRIFAQYVLHCLFGFELDHLYRHKWHEFASVPDRTDSQSSLIICQTTETERLSNETEQRLSPTAGIAGLLYGLILTFDGIIQYTKSHFLACFKLQTDTLAPVSAKTESK